MKKRFYVDACIYINLWQKEGDPSKGIPYWRLAKDFFKKFDNDACIIYYSGFLLKELEFVLPKALFDKKRLLFGSSPNFHKLMLTEEGLAQARVMESTLDEYVGFYDIIHMLLSERAGATLVTRDKKLLEVADSHCIPAKKPEDCS